MRFSSLLVVAALGLATACSRAEQPPSAPPPTAAPSAAEVGTPQERQLWAVFDRHKEEWQPCEDLGNEYQAAHRRYMEVLEGKGSTPAAAIKASEKEMVKVGKAQRDFLACRDPFHTRLKPELQPVGASEDAIQAAWDQWRKRNFATSEAGA